MDAGFLILPSAHARAAFAAATAHLVEIHQYYRRADREARLFDARRRNQEAREAWLEAVEREAHERAHGRRNHSAACG